MKYTIQYDHETDGRWIAEIPKLPGVMAYGSNKAEARAAVIALGREVLSSAESEPATETHDLFAAI